MIFKKAFSYVYVIISIAVIGIVWLAISMLLKNVMILKETQKILDNTQYKTWQYFLNTQVVAYCFGTKDNMTKDDFNNYSGSIDTPNSSNFWIVYIIKEDQTTTSCNQKKNDLPLLAYKHVYYVCSEWKNNCKIWKQKLYKNVNITVNNKSYDKILKLK